jgi:hypothetical protein
MDKAKFELEAKIHATEARICGLARSLAFSQIEFNDYEARMERATRREHVFSFASMFLF